VSGAVFFFLSDEYVPVLIIRDRYGATLDAKLPDLEARRSRARWGRSWHAMRCSSPATGCSKGRDCDAILVRQVQIHTGTVRLVIRLVYRARFVALQALIQEGSHSTQKTLFVGSVVYSNL
jgi:hypothetical protein